MVALRRHRRDGTERVRRAVQSGRVSGPATVGRMEPTPIPVPDGLRGLDPAAIAALRDLRVELERLSGLDERAIELARLGALIALGAPADSLEAHVRRARTIGLPDEEVWGTVMAVAPLVGVPRLIGAIPAIRSALEEP